MRVAQFKILIKVLVQIGLLLANHNQIKPQLIKTASAMALGKLAKEAEKMEDPVMEMI